MDDAPGWKVDQQSLRRAAACPGVRWNASERPCASVMACSLVLWPPRLMPIAWASAPLFRLRPSGAPSHACRRSALRPVARPRRQAPRTPHAIRLSPTSACPIIQRLMGPVDHRSVLPATPQLQHMHDPADHPPIIDTRHAARLVWQQRLKPTPLTDIQPKPT